eukprot:jgi/Chlat1/9226/Chrsp99S08506
MEGAATRLAARASRAERGTRSGAEATFVGRVRRWERKWTRPPSLAAANPYRTQGLLLPVWVPAPSQLGGGGGGGGGGGLGSSSLGGGKPAFVPVTSRRRAGVATRSTAAAEQAEEQAQQQEEQRTKRIKTGGEAEASGLQDTPSASTQPDTNASQPLGPAEHNQADVAAETGNAMEASPPPLPATTHHEDNAAEPPAMPTGL